ncbi:MAG: hypothetical protein KGH69_02205 [Candidatus Micrarchaeota archaeon]|nr:hypothetical protein [Candidatus Micrarchaeota archaeon]
MAKVPPFAFVGKFASGKGIYADSLMQLLESGFSIKVYKVPSFSAKIKEIAADLFDEETANDRTVWQAIGNMMREIDRKVWANVLIRKILENGADSFVVEGFRDVEELMAFRERFPEMIVIGIDASFERRIDAYRKKYGKEPTKEQLEHNTEKAIEMMPVDMVLVNDYTTGTMKAQLESIVSALKAGTMHEFLQSNKRSLR